MRVLIGHQLEMFEWLATTSSLKEIRLALMAIRKTAVLTGPRKPKDLINELRGQGVLSESVISDLNDFFREIPWALVPDGTKVEEPGFGDSFDGDFASLAVSDEFRLASDFRQRGIAAGEHLGDAWERIFGHLLPICEEIEIQDSWIGKAIATGSPAWDFLIDQLSKFPSCSLRIRTEVPSDNSFAGYNFAKVRDLMVERLNLSLQKHNSKNKVVFNVYRFTPHNRWFVLKLRGSENTLGCDLPHGIDTFKADPADEPHSIGEEKSGVISSRSKSSKWVPDFDKLQRFELAPGLFSSSIQVYS